MALGRPAFCASEPGLFPLGCPIVRLDGNAVDRLQAIAGDELLRSRLRNAGIAYVRAYHDARRIAQWTITSYRSAQERNA